MTKGYSFRHPDKVEFSYISIREYIDEEIKQWRLKLDKASSDEQRMISACYIDAYQSIRSAVYGSTLLKNNAGDNNE